MPTLDLSGRDVSFIVNPVAGGLPRRDRLDAAIAAAANAHGFRARVEQTRSAGHASELAAQAEARADAACIVVGGDGTLNEALNGLGSTECALGLIPAGTANVWAREAGVPRDPRQALAAQLAGPVLTIDSGRAGDRRFLLMASYGLDAEAMQHVGAGRKRRLGRLAYVLSGFRTGLTYPGFRCRLVFDEAETVELNSALMVFGNTRSYGGAARITADAVATDGQLDCVAFRGVGVRRGLKAIGQVLLRRHLQAGDVLFRRAHRIRIEADGPLPPMQLDGDALPQPAAELAVDPGALRIFVPAAQRPVFRAPDG